MKRLLFSALLVLVTKAAVGGIFFGLLYAGAESSPAFRAEGEEAHGVAMVGYVAWSVAFMFLFSRGAERRGWREGLRFGIVVWLFYFVPMILGIYGYFAVDKSWAGAALVGGLAEALACGVVASLVYRTRETPALAN
jgi:hypothetical protein